jgi:hypothetical protein
MIAVVLAAIAIVWTLLAVLAVGICAAARLGDRAERESPSPISQSTKRPRTIHRHARHRRRPKRRWGALPRI